jgi:peptidoglycan/xylan/chitin deacetylase (PgdA/CDA1 family)
VRPRSGFDVTAGLAAAAVVLFVCAGAAVGLSPDDQPTGPGAAAAAAATTAPSADTMPPEPGPAPEAAAADDRAWAASSRWHLGPDAPGPDSTGSPTSTPEVPAGPTTPGKGRTVYLTFDDGPSPRWTDAVLAVLAAHDARATFFFLGSQVSGSPDVARRVAEAGHGIGNHTYDHKNLRALRPRAVRHQLRSTQQVIERATGSRPTCMRPPYGATDRRVRAQTRELGMTTRLWDVDPRDWERHHAGPIVRETVKRVRDGSVVLLHDSGGDRTLTLQALPAILEELAADGFTFGVLCR